MGKKRALCAGVGDYLLRQELMFPPNDIKLILEILTNLNWDVREELLEKDCIATNIYETIDSFMADSIDGDCILFYFSGHGIRLKGYEHLALYDRGTNRDDRYLRDEVYVELLEKCPSEVKFISLLDCCFSGGMLDNFLMNKPSNHIAITASSKSEKAKGKSFEGVYYSSFTYAIYRNHKDNGLQSARKWKPMIQEILEEKRFGNPPKPVIYIPEALNEFELF